jgi:hypothetical protein
MLAGFDHGPHLSRAAGPEAATMAALVPSDLSAAYWAPSGPGLSWPVQYHLVWTPIHKGFVVTASADAVDAFGYADFALGHFGRDDDVGQPVIGVIKRDWRMQRV